MKKAADLIARSNIGYDQGQRWTFFQNGKVIKGREADCSTVCGAIMKLGGYPVDLSGTFYTGNFATKAKAAGFTVLAWQSNRSLRDGDFLLNPGRHVEFFYGGRMFSALADERGKARGGKAGNQNGRESRWADVGGSWKYVIRPPREVLERPNPVGSNLKKGSKGAAVKKLQQQLNSMGLNPRLVTDGDFGAKTHAAVVAAQKRLGFKGGDVDGVVGPKTRAAIEKALRPTPAAPKNTVFHIATANVHHPGWGGPSDHKAKCNMMAELNSSIVAVQEGSTAFGRTYLERFKKHAMIAHSGGYIRTFYNKEKYRVLSKTEYAAPDAFHGALAIRFQRVDTCEQFQVVNVFVRPTSVASAEAKQKDIDASFELVSPSFPCIVLGDFNLSAFNYPADFTLAQQVDTLDAKGTQYYDNILTFERAALTSDKVVDPKNNSDHLWRTARVLISGKGTR